MEIAFVLNGLRAGPMCEETLHRRFAGFDLAVLRTRFAGHATGLARAAAVAGADTVVAVGGDGTVSEVVNGMAGTPAALGVIPLGTANDFAAGLGLTRRFSDACDVIEAGLIAHVDLLSANGRYFVSAGGLGLACNALALAGARRGSARRRNPLVYPLGLIRAFARQGARGERVSIVADGRRRACSVSMLMMCNQPWLGRYFKVSPDAQLQSGLVHLCWFEATVSAFRLGLSMWRTRRGAHLACPHVATLAAPRIDIECERPLAFFVDGELEQPCQRLRLRAHPRALAVLAPTAEKNGNLEPPERARVPVKRNGKNRYYRSAGFSKSTSL